MGEEDTRNGSQQWATFLADPSIEAIEVELGPGEAVMPGLVGGEPIYGPCRIRGKRLEDGNVVVAR